MISKLFFTKLLFILIATADCQLECGITSNRNVSERKPTTDKENISYIVGGHLANDQDFPWIVALVNYYQCDPYVNCGGSIISKKWFVSAGHCYPGLVR